MLGTGSFQHSALSSTLCRINWRRLGVSAVIGSFYTHGKGNERTDKQVTLDNINAIKEAREELDKKVNEVVDGGPLLDVSTTRDLCKKVLDLPPVLDDEKKKDSGNQSNERAR